MERTRMARAIVLMIIGIIGILASFSFNKYGADFYNDILSSINWILRIISLTIAAIGIINLIEIKRMENEQESTNPNHKQ